MDHAAVRAHRMDRRRPLSRPDQIGIAIVLEDRHAVFGRQSQQFGAPALRHDAAGRVLHGRDGVDVFRPDAAALEIGQRRGQHVHAHAILVEGNADHVDAEPRQAGQRALIALLLDNHGIAARQQRAVDEVERLQRAGHDQEIVDRAVDTGVALEFRHKEFAQGQVALGPCARP